MTDTPETDDLARGNHVVPTEFAEQLERERDEAIAEATNAINDIICVRWERDEIRKIVESLTTTSFDLLAALEKAREEIEMMGIRYAAAEMHHETNMQEVTKERDRLVEALEQTLNATVLNHRNDRWHIDAEHTLQLIKKQ